MSSVPHWVTRAMAAARLPPPSPFFTPLNRRSAAKPWDGRPRAVGRSRAFTLVELLTVIAILAVLGTLLLTALHSTQKKSRQARCAANLHQISLALNMYLDDADHRPQSMDSLVQSKYLPSPQALICLQDRTGDWGRLAGAVAGVPTPPGFGGTDVPPFAGGADQVATLGETLPCSYLHPLRWDDAGWNRLGRAGSLGGLAACQVHGLGKPDPTTPSIYDFEGLVLRAQRDGAVVRRQVFWARNGQDGRSPAGPGEFLGPAGAGASAAESGVDPAWPLFLDADAP